MFLLGLFPLQASNAQTPAIPTTSASTESAQRLYEQTRPRKLVAFNPQDFDKYIGYYHFSSPTVLFHIYRTDDRYFTQLTGQQPVEVFPESPNEFFATVEAAQIAFVMDSEGQATGLVLHQNGSLRPANRVSDAVATKEAAEFQQRIASNTSHLRTEAALRHQIDTLERGEPDYSVMTPEFAEATRQQLPQIKNLLFNVGDLKSLAFSKVLSNGSDRYIATFARGRLECTIAPLSPDGRVTAAHCNLLH
jgi:hypothetical protein